MDTFHEKLDQIVKNLSYIEGKRVNVGKFLRKINDSFEIGPDGEVADVQTINKCGQQMKDDVSVVGIDGGMVKHSLHGLDLMLLRATAVNFVYSKGNLKDVFYYPSANSFPQPKVIVESLSDVEFNLCTNVERQIVEVTTAVEAMEKMKPDIMLMDGSVLPQYTFKPDKSELGESYKQLIRAYKDLYRKAKGMKVTLAGVIEDSRSSKFAEIVNRKIMDGMRTEVSKELKAILEKTKDSNLLFYTLERGERTCVFSYFSGGNGFIKEFKDLEKSFYSFYIKTVDFDRPLRGDFLSNGNPLDTVNEITPVLLGTCGHSGYGLPAVLIEADQRAKLSDKDMEMFYADLVSRVGNVSSLFKMRREMRPF
ncbi:hypothetical protein A3K63_02330 [Candidatus Micrarchaeota archaeon RBG_16_49_10]|nr:MAG: hypothetical protein A3K63_02330 [Candidatus Micrarchaeota archaeon RBG_16_49_10]